ncbi:bifunctional riboflavin kinase/FAD synthetase [Herbaspirillum sp. RTI4]|uniref:bifunctional riboflavin kinase/FAD synthetase n=1 Tax=Herbaspirillum sp. RTI4 TaxID=3048640 RepID=UPI002AB45FDF|nr:bifunctional riboflavin kinase/FAD synthetase [Herbaspirillum sp. RTI4]MDY7578167.1 bifunctional riboflavin kinase/FAD synthetase [Herbaspirillum sp. RTI4]MEA9980756.1 bifunctional riboflavin kinase/FAD synthetase [Herbaspirillum sp. RTI4]
MKVFRGLPNAESRAPCALTIGNFDGVHCGHQALLARVRHAASELELEAAVMTFEPHPREFFAMQAGRPDQAPPRIAGLRDKLDSLTRAGVDRVVVEHFNHRFASLTPQQFIEDILVKGLHARWLMVGEDFCFGSRRSGNIATLTEAGKHYGFQVETMPTITHEGLRVSSSAVRSALAQGDFTQAQSLLGHTYRISGHVIHGQKLGRTLGFPTLNMHIGHHRPALSGIFVVQVHGLAEQPLPAVASLGIRPTVDASGRVLLETHLLDYSGDCYGKLLQIEFLEKLRDEEKYDDLPTLTAAIANDVVCARAWFAEAGRHDHAAISATDRI